MKADVQQAVSAILIRIALILAMTVTTLIFSSRWPATGLVPALATVLPIALLWGWAELRLHRARLSAERQLEQACLLTGSLAHDLRTPLCTAMNAAANLREATRQETLDPERIDRAYAATEKSLQRCHHLITAVLDYSRSGQSHLQPLWIDPLLEKIVAEFPLPTNIHLDTRFEAQVRVAVAPCQLRRAIHNLIENAVQAMTAETDSAKTHRLKVASRIQRTTVEITVQDNGPGIPAEEQAKVFTPLYTGREGGVGLGLPIVQDVVGQHSGSIRLSSPPQEGRTPGAGACFTLNLPVL